MEFIDSLTAVELFILSIGFVLAIGVIFMLMALMRVKYFPISNYPIPPDPEKLKKGHEYKMPDKDKPYGGKAGIPPAPIKKVVYGKST